MQKRISNNKVPSSTISSSALSKQTTLKSKTIPKLKIKPERYEYYQGEAING